MEKSAVPAVSALLRSQCVYTGRTVSTRFGLEQTEHVSMEPLLTFLHFAPLPGRDFKRPGGQVDNPIGAVISSLGFR